MGTSKETQPITWKKIKGHLRTITEHKLLVMRHCFRIGLYRQGLMHDLSKYMPSELFMGFRYFDDGHSSPNNGERRGKVGKSIEDKTDKNGVPYCQFSAFSAEKVQDGFEYIWVSFFLFDGKREVWLQPGVKANIKGAFSVSVFNDKLDFSCRVSEMNEYVPQPYNGN